MYIICSKKFSLGALSPTFIMVVVIFSPSPGKYSVYGNSISDIIKSGRSESAPTLNFVIPQLLVSSSSGTWSNSSIQANIKYSPSLRSSGILTKRSNVSVTPGSSDSTKTIPTPVSSMSMISSPDKKTDKYSSEVVMSPLFAMITEPIFEKELPVKTRLSSN